ncbi:aromatic ring-hydroxylating dioxygenase subunit alpha [Novosphingobium rosa]|uniref:aromatic ring-hydroxylating dioxygenase subunit alpha n=1 Tax=Novosphingobium rosa TaxID=76978 RepID=UPI00082C0C69|nr:aromatic ring-hydroxylating dioxygenase subunit alpha [Novosphingobium rosa]
MPGTSAAKEEGFLYNNWYVAGWGTDLAPGERVGRTFLNQPVVLFRTQSGEVSALEDRCCHRALPLSFGMVEGERIRCSYHGLEFNTQGKCEKIPAQDKVPSTACVRRYPLVERDSLMWIWMGEPALADETAIPAHPWHANPRFRWKSFHYDIQGNWELMIENLMDLSHLPYIHAQTIGGNPELHFGIKTNSTRDGDVVRVSRHMPNSEPPPTYKTAKGFTGKVDRWQEIEFMPVLIRINTGACDADTGAYEGKREHGFSMVGFHGITPETETTTHYFWSVATDALADGVPEKVFQQTADTFREDQEVLELQQLRISAEPDRPLLDIASDVGSRQARQVLRRLMKAEREPGMVAA